MTKMTSVLMAGVTLAAVLAGSQAFAGYWNGPTPVWIYDDGATRYATGGISDARYSADSVQYIGCGFRGSAGSTGRTSMTCHARDAAGKPLWCSSDLPSFVATAALIQQGTTLSFDADSSGRCLNIHVNRGSHHTF